tara:strand:- start:3426 stop:4436 length:1011 start_codon:yes stop_codon:yes gene_type:complete
MSESYIGLAPSYGVFEKQVIAGTTATSYPLDFDVVQATQLMVSLDGIVQEPDYSYSVGRSATGTMQLTFASALTEQTASSVTLTSGSTTISAVSNTGLYNVGQPITGNANIPANTFITAIPSSSTLTISNAATGSGSANQTIKIGSRIFVTYLGKQLLTPSANNARTYPKLDLFTGDGSDTTFVLSTTPPSAGAIMVFVDGVFQREGSSNAWTLSGDTLTFTAAPANTANIAVMHLATEQSFLPTVVDRSVTNAKISLSNSNANTAPTIDNNFGAATKTINSAGTGKTYTVDDLLVYLNGVHLIPTTDYTVSGTTLTLVGGAPGAGSSLVVRYLPK